jgi:long-subunit acyl-CoA synthetase (AMP-forming)
MYLLDTNTYIQAKNLHYHMSFCPAYWDWLDQQYQQGSIASISSVYDELVTQNDDLSIWVKTRKDQFQAISAKETQLKLAEVAQYVADLPNKNPENIASFLSGADPWLIAQAAVTNAIIVTHEVPVPDESKKVKIPNIGKHFDVTCINTFELLRILEARFTLDK